MRFLGSSIQVGAARINFSLQFGRIWSDCIGPPFLIELNNEINDNNPEL